MQDMRTTWQHIRMMSNIPDYSGFPFISAARRYNEDHPDARPISLDVDLLCEELRYFGKAVAVDCLDPRSSCPDAL